jgi:hypothetical protein
MARDGAAGDLIVWTAAHLSALRFYCAGQKLSADTLGTLIRMDVH